MLRTVYGDHQRFLDTYLRPYPGYYLTGDGCVRDQDGYYWITGRVDDVINVSGHRIGSAEVEHAIVGHEKTAEAAVVGYPHEVKGAGLVGSCHAASEFTERLAMELEAIKKAHGAHLDAFGKHAKDFAALKARASRTSLKTRRIETDGRGCQEKEKARKQGIQLCHNSLFS